MSNPPPPLPNKVPEMLALADAVAVFVPARRRLKNTGVGEYWTTPYFYVQMREGVPSRGSVAVESHGGWTYKAFSDALKELLE